METLYAVLDWPGTKWLLLVMLFVMPVASLLTWAERRQSAMMQDRLGPNRANIGPIKLWGILHFVADAVKMIKKEDFIPANAHKWLFSLAPILSLAPVLIAFAIIPFGPTIYPEQFLQALDVTKITPDSPSITLQMFQVDFGLLFYFAIMSIANFGATIAGWASYNKWALLGGLRASSQMMSYEVSMGLSLMGVFLLMGTLEPGAMVDWQGEHHWGFLVQPVAMILFFTAAIAETKRGPFDLPEGEPEIIGYFVEYSGIRWGMFFLAEFIEIVFVGMIMTTVFFGGYHIPFLDNDGVFRLSGWEAPFALTHGLVVLLQILSFGFKVVFFCWLQLAIRWTLPRFRADQLMDLGWKRLLPFALANLMVTALVALLMY
jgi:NADH-quinone oxidoreductase subunit H